jgi:hypothetical protein
MNADMINVFVFATEYHFLLAMSIIEEHFSEAKYFNKFVFLGGRLSDINISELPANIKAIRLPYQIEDDFKAVVHREVLNEPVENLFVVNAYRPPDTYILSSVPKSTTRHLMQDGALFYNKIEKFIYKHRVKEMFRLYWGMWSKRIFFTDLVFYGRFMEKSGYIDQLWMTNPEVYIGPKTRKKINRINLFPLEKSAQLYRKYFQIDQNKLTDIQDYLIYMSVIIRDDRFFQREIDQIKLILKKINKSKVLIKLHPNSSPAQYDKLKSEFGDMVFKNHVPAEMYIANAKDSYVIGCASTSLFYNNPACKYFALKKFYQELGIYSKWYNIKLPKHVTVVDSLDGIIVE